MKRLLLFAASRGKGTAAPSTMADPRQVIIHPDDISQAERARQRNICAIIGAMILLLAFWPMEGCSPDIEQPDNLALAKEELEGLPPDLDIVLDICSDPVPGTGGGKEISSGCSQPVVSGNDAKR
jgi:hypothetical protein